MDHDYQQHQSFLGRWIVLGLLAYFPQARFVILAISIVCVVISGLFMGADQIPVTVNDNPICNRVWMVTPSQDNPLSDIPGGFIRTTNGEVYVHEANGTGYCRLRHETTWTAINDIYRQKWWEIPSKYGQKVAPALPTDRHLPAKSAAFLFAAVVLFFGLWLPSTILAYVGHKIYNWYEREKQT